MGWLFWKKDKINEDGKINVHKKVKIGIAFGGGGARGVGHIGAIKALEELSKNEDKIIYPGHGERAMLSGAINRIKFYI